MMQPLLLYHIVILTEAELKLKNGLENICITVTHIEIYKKKSFTTHWQNVSYYLKEHFLLYKWVYFDTFDTICFCLFFPYSLDLALAATDFYLFCSLLNALYGALFNNGVEKLRSLLDKFFESKLEEFYHWGSKTLLNNRSKS